MPLHTTNSRPSILLVALSVAISASMFAQSPFQNLDFEATTIPQTQPSGFVSSTSALPAWSVYYGAIQQSQVTFNAIALGSTHVCLLGTRGSGIYKCIQGGYSVMLQGGSTATAASIRQVGLVPADAQFIQFKAQPAPGSFVVALNGQSIPFYPLAVGLNYTLYGGDVSAFANQTVELSFSAMSSSLGPNNWNLDSITFVPEPSVLALAGLGAVFLALRHGASGREVKASAKPGAPAGHPGARA